MDLQRDGPKSHFIFQHLEIITSMCLLNEQMNEWIKTGLRTPAAPPSPSPVSTGLGASHSTPTVVRGLLGGSVILPLNISVDMEIEHIAWNDPQNALALVTPRSDIIIMDRSYQGRINIFTQNNSLSINKLTWKDAGSYKAQINQKNSEVTINEEFFLHIYGEFQGASVDFGLLFLKGRAFFLSLSLQEFLSLGQRESSHWSFSPNSINIDVKSEKQPI